MRKEQRITVWTSGRKDATIKTRSGAVVCIMTGKCRAQLLMFFFRVLVQIFYKMLEEFCTNTYLFTRLVHVERNKRTSQWEMKPTPDGTKLNHITKRLHYRKEERKKRKEKGGGKKMDCSLRSGHNSSYQAKTEAPDITQSRRT